MAELTAKRLASPSEAVVVPCLHIGRALTGKILSFIDVKRPSLERTGGIQFLKPGETFPTEYFMAMEAKGVHGIRFIIGPPGTGKSTSLTVAAHFLSTSYAAEKPVSRRIVFVDGAEAAEEPEQALFSAIATACAAESDHDQLSLLNSCRRLRDFLNRSDVRYTIIVDDGNKIPALDKAAKYLATLVPACVLVLCASSSSDWMDVIRHPKTLKYLIVNEGLQGEEFDSFCGHYKINLLEIDLRRTGTNPRLLLLYHQDKDGFDKAVTTLREAVDEFLTHNLGSSRRDQLLRELTGAVKLEPLCRVQDSKCFYTREDGTLDCISEELRTYSLKKLAATIQEDDLARACELIAVLTGAIRRDGNTVRIGWNAEVAVLFALKFLNLNIPYKTDATVNTGRPVFELFQGQMSPEVLSKRRESDQAVKTLPCLYASTRLNHIGLDFYLELDDAVIAFQVSVAQNAESRHVHTVRKAEELFASAGKNLNILVYVIPCEFSSYLVNLERYSYYYVTMPFGALCSCLSDIEQRLKEIRGSSAKKDVCCRCEEAAGDYNWVQCDVCFSWYHWSCVDYNPAPPAATAQLLARAERQATQEYECFQCKEFYRSSARGKKRKVK